MASKQRILIIFDSLSLASVGKLFVRTKIPEISVNISDIDNIQYRRSSRRCKQKLNEPQPAELMSGGGEGRGGS